MTESVFITGGNGFVGRAIVNALKEKHPHWVITIFDLQVSEKERPGVSYELGNITIGAEVDLTFVQIKPPAIIHTAGTVPLLASRYGKKDRDRIFYVNVKGTRNILTAAKRHWVKAFVWTSSFTAVADGLWFQYPNIDETWPTSIHSLVYGELMAKVLLVLDDTPSE